MTTIWVIAIVCTIGATNLALGFALDYLIERRRVSSNAEGEENENVADGAEEAASE